MFKLENIIVRTRIKPWNSTAIGIYINHGIQTVFKSFNGGTTISRNETVARCWLLTRLKRYIWTPITQDGVAVGSNKKCVATGGPLRKRLNPSISENSRLHNLHWKRSKSQRTLLQFWSARTTLGAFPTLTNNKEENSLSFINGACHGSLQLVPQQEYQYTSSTHQCHQQYGSRYWIEENILQESMATNPDHISSNQPSLGTLLNRPLCRQDDETIAKLRVMATGFGRYP